jgi:hypothetical protein
LKKIIKKTKNYKTIKILVGKHCSNPLCFVRKATIVVLNQLIIKKKSIKIILEKIIKKPMWGNTIAILSVFF